MIIITIQKVIKLITFKEVGYIIYFLVINIICKVQINLSISHGGNKYWAIESAIPEELQGKMAGVMEDFETRIDAFISENAAEGFFPFNIGEVMSKSPEEQAWDLKSKPGFEWNKIYLLGRKGYFNDYVGNVAWASIMRNAGWPLSGMIIGAGLNQSFMQDNPTRSEKLIMWLTHPYTFGDYPRDTKAIIHGYFINLF
jgi:hypothetical protein